jgi:uncharacterized membrane protein YfcA
MFGSRTASDLAIFFILTLAAEVLGTLGGFGSSMFFVPVAQFLFDFKTVLGLTGLLHIFSNASKIFLFRNSIKWSLVASVGIPSLALAVAGAWLTTWVDFKYAQLLLGIFLLSYAFFLLVRPDFSLAVSLRNSVVGGALAGFMAGFVGTGGAIRGLVLASLNLEKNLFVGTSAAIDMGVDLSRTMIYLENDYLQWRMWIYVPLLLIASFAGSWLGKRLLQKMSQEVFRKILLGFISAMGMTLIYQGIMSAVEA